jgi:ribonucleoside-diphosphate reductase alpha chain
LSIAPTGTISLAFADNASNGIEPAFSWSYTRKKRQADGSLKEYAVEDHAWRLYRHLKGPDAPLTKAFVTALEMSAQAHAAMVGAVAPFVDSAISKTVNVPADYPYADFQGLYLQAWRAGLKGLATYRPNSVLGSVLSVTPTGVAPSRCALPTPTAAWQLERLPAPVLASLRWPGRPELPAGNPAWTFMVRHLYGDFALFVGEEGNPPRPFEVWVNGNEQPRGLGALAKSLSMDLRSNDAAWLRLKLDVLSTVAEERPFEMPFPPTGRRGPSPAWWPRWPRCCAGAANNSVLLQPGGATPVIDAMFSRDEPHTSTSGTLAWAVDVDNPATGEAFTLMLKEVTLPTPEGGIVTRPCAVAFSGNYPKALDGLARVLSLDMRVIDPAWIGMKLRKLLNYAEPLGHFMAFVPGERAPADLAQHRGLCGAADHPPLRDAGRAGRHRPAAAPDGRAGNAGPAAGHAADGRQALPRMRQRHRDPQGRVRRVRSAPVGSCGVFVGQCGTSGEEPGDEVAEEPKRPGADKDSAAAQSWR